MLKNAKPKNNFNYCYVSSMFLNENESDKFELIQKDWFCFQALATGSLVCFQ